MAAEKRKYTRYELMYKVIYSTLEDPDKKFSVRSFNISFGGIGLKIEEFIKGNGQLKLSIFSPYKGVPVEAKGRLVWQNRFRDIAEHRAGVQFTEIPWSEIKKLLGEAA